MHGARDDTERARETSTPPPSAARSARCAPAGASLQTFTAAPEAWHRLEAIWKPCRPVAAISSSILAVMKLRATTRRKPIKHKMNVIDLEHNRTCFDAS